MTPVSIGLTVEIISVAFAVLVASLVPPRFRPVAAGLLCSVACATGAATGIFAMSGVRGTVVIATALPAEPITFSPDRLGGLFILIASVVGLLVSVYGIAYTHGADASRTSWSAMATFLLGMQLVPAASDAAAFLLAWEMMALGSTVLLLAEHGSRPRVNSAAVWYAVMSQLSFLALLGGFAALSVAAGGSSFAKMEHASPNSGLAVCAFLLFVLGFGSKAGVVPLHVWLPKAHPEAPSHVSAAMSAAMVKMGVYGILLICLRLLPHGPAWWGILLMILGGLSAMYGILQASVTSDIKILLAYSTTENIGLIFLAIGAAVLLAASGIPTVAAVLLLAALLLSVSHAAFKVTLFLGAGSVVQATGERDLDRLGGLGRRMPWTSGAFGIACLGAAALPISSGFVAEWLLLQSLIHGTALGHQSAGVLVSIAMPLAVATVALTAGLAVLTFVKAYGIAFLARARTQVAAEATETPVLMRVVLVLGAITVVGLGLAPGWVASSLAATVAPHLLDGGGVATVAGVSGISVPHLGVLLDPIALLAMAAIFMAVMAVVVGRLAIRHRVREVDSVWGGGGDRMRPRMQYTATSYAEPVLRVFDDVLKPARDVIVTHAGESRYLVDRVLFRQDLRDVVERRLYRPVLTIADRFGVSARRLQNGSVHRYIGYSLFALLIVLVLATV
jgi:formate hydrogenlyase subunit 3/multisubunit Na+/H+ antiporter MnhD subunit